MASFEIYKTGTEFRWRFKGANGEIVASGEGYTTKAKAVEGVDVLKREAATATVKDLT